MLLFIVFAYCGLRKVVFRSICCHPAHVPFVLVSNGLCVPRVAERLSSQPTFVTPLGCCLCWFPMLCVSRRLLKLLCTAHAGHLARVPCVLILNCFRARGLLKAFFTANICHPAPVPFVLAYNCLCVSRVVQPGHNLLCSQCEQHTHTYTYTHT